MNSATPFEGWQQPFLNMYESSRTIEHGMEIDEEIAVSGLRSKILRLSQSSALERHSNTKTPLQRMQDCRDGLATLDARGWNRSFHQRLFHEDFLVSTVRPNVFPQRPLA